MPKYKAFNKRFGYLSDAIKTLAETLLSALLGLDDTCVTHVMDSMPIVFAKESCSGRAKVAPELCDKGYCDSKNMWFYGVRLHTLGQSQYKTLPLPKLMQLAPASHHDRKVAEEMLFDVHGIDLFADKAYINVAWQSEIATNNHINIITPVKRAKGQERLNNADSLFLRRFPKSDSRLNHFLFGCNNLLTYNPPLRFVPTMGLFPSFSLVLLLLAWLFLMC
jgi:hypothetical protein